jgi:hypothetical protein
MGVKHSLFEEQLKLKLFERQAIREICDPKKDEENKQIWILRNFLIPAGQLLVYLGPHGLGGIYK